VKGTGNCQAVAESKGLRRYDRGSEGGDAMQLSFAAQESSRMVHIPEACLLLMGALRQRFTVELHYTQEHGFAGELCGSKKT